VVRSYRQYRRAFPPDGVRVIAEVTHDTPMLAAADIEFLDDAGGLIARLDGYECALDPGLERAYRRSAMAVNAESRT
jgi:hypothetical protein